MIGADPELFYHDGKKFISAIDKIGGTKEQPRRLLCGFALQEDNVTVEYNIPAVDDVERFVWANQLMLEEIRHIGEGLGLKSVIASSANFTEDQLADPRAQVFGCDPDFDAWELEPNPKPEAANKTLRSAGGHIHLGMEDASNKQKILAVRAMDLLVGVPLAFLDRKSERRALYGRAGACRFKPYGVEYRSPSNFWLTDEKLMHQVGLMAIRVSSNPGFLQEVGDAACAKEEEIKAAINNLDETAYLKLKKLISGQWPSNLLNRIEITSKPKVEDDEFIKLIIEE